MKLKSFVMFSCILFLLVGWNYANTNNQVQNNTNEQKRDQIQSIEPNHQLVNSPRNINTPKTPYILPIKGISPKLTPSAWQRMLQWRRDILVYPQRYPNDVFLNGPNKKMVALTFDDGPEPMITPKIIAALKQENVKGTFFFIGEKVQKYPYIVKSTYKNGNVISSHNFRHDVLTKKTETELHQDLDKASEAIRQVIGKSPALLRPPYGEIDDKVVNAIKKDHYKIILWSIDTLDWSNRDQAMIQQNVLDNVRNGDIILMHTDNYTIETAKAVPTIIKELKRRGFQIVDVATLLNTSPYK
jgi:peptidoglycan-N-acetylglucosamine deacetylase